MIGQRLTADALYNLLLLQVLDGSLEPGPRLPTEQALADQHGVARSTMRKALERLRADRLIVSRRGDGHYIAGLSETEQCNIKLDFDTRFEEVFEVRRLLDGASAAHAAEIQDQACINLLEKSQTEMQRQIDAEQIDLLEIRRADIDFHSELSRRSPNALLVEITETLVAAIGPFWINWRAFDIGQQRQLAQSTLNEHALVLAAIKAGDPETAERAMRHHFRTSGDRYKKVFGD
ncbi:MAG: FadR family transcriptional regulator [Hyphomicrobiaceae bacterium]